MSDEEKKAIESLKNIAIYVGDNYTFSQQGIRNLRENLRIVLPVIEKQSKEIEHWKAGMTIVEKDKNNHIERLEKEIEELNLKNEKLYEDNLTLAQEIKEFIEGTNDVKYYSTSFIKNHYISKDKIKAKIEEVSNGTYDAKIVLQSLLEKE